MEEKIGTLTQIKFNRLVRLKDIKKEKNHKIWLGL